MLVERKVQKYGWIPDLPDIRDFNFLKVGEPVIPKSVDFRQLYKMPDVFDQGQLGSCTGNGISFMLAFNVLNNHIQTPFTSLLPFSRLFIYYNERVIEGTVNQDSGAQIRDGLKSISSEGACVESFFPYDVDSFANTPTSQAYSNALLYKAIVYSRLNNLNKLELIQCLLEGYCFVFGFSVYDSFETQEVYDTGVVNLPASSETLQGGHCVCCVGYDLDTDRFICVNSWGNDFGQNGYFTIPATYLCNDNLASDFWTVRVML